MTSDFEGVQMQRLTGLDAGFLYMETPSSAMHVAGLAIFDPSTAPGGWTVEKYKEMVRSRLHLAPPFRRRLVDVPFQLHHPLWIEDPDFDLDWHIRHIAVPAPGGPNELAGLASHLVSLQLERTRPLWEIWLIEGLENGNIATLSKIHHAAIDGASGAELTVALFDLSPEIAEVPPPEAPWVPDRLPTDTEMVSYAAASLARQPLAALKAVRRTASAAITLRRANREPGITPPPAPFSAPRTSLNRPLTPHRSYAMTTVSLADVKAVKNAFGTTVNDVILALCGGALQRYFDEHDEPLDGPLVAMVPVSVRSDDEKSSMGNRVTPSLTSLATDIDDPVERLRTIHEAMKRTKEQTNAIGADTLTNWAEFAAPMVFSRATRLYSNMKMADRHRPLFNVTISNVPGPPFPLYVAGAKMIANYPVGPIFDGGGLNMTVMSYQDHLDFGLLACPDVVDDVWTIAAAVADSLDDLMKAVKASASGHGTTGSDSDDEVPAEPPDAVTARTGSTIGGDARDGSPKIGATTAKAAPADPTTPEPEAPKPAATEPAPADPTVAERPADAAAAPADPAAAKPAPTDPTVAEPPTDAATAASTRNNRRPAAAKASGTGAPARKRSATNPADAKRSATSPAADQPAVTVPKTGGPAKDAAPGKASVPKPKTSTARAKASAKAKASTAKAKAPARAKLSTAKASARKAPGAKLDTKKTSAAAGSPAADGPPAKRAARASKAPKASTKASAAKKVTAKPTTTKAAATGSPRPKKPAAKRPTGRSS